MWESPSSAIFYFFSFVLMVNGIIKKKIEEKGIGFISVEGSDDLFFHMSACDGQYDSLQEGMAVTCDSEDSEKGKRAVNVKAA